MSKSSSIFIVRTAMALLLFIFVSLTSIASAEKQEWIDKDYNFNNVKRVLLFNPTIEQKLYNGINEHEILEIFAKKAKLPENIKFITPKKFIENIKFDTGIDVPKLYEKNPQEAEKVIFEGISRYADLVIDSHVFEYSVGSEYREGYTFNTTQYQTAYVNGTNGSATVNMPVTVQHNVPGGNIPVAYASVRWEVIDTKTGKSVVIRLDDRAKGNPTVFDNTKPRDLYGRISGSFFDFMSDKLEKKNDWY